MKRSLVFTAVVFAFWAGEAQAANLAVIKSPPTILDLAVLLLTFAAIVVGYQLLGSLKGGYLSKCWQLFIGGFAVVALSQIAKLLQVFEIVSLPVWIAPLLLVGGVGVLFYGVFETKRILG
jgi:hypothetical protein